MTIAPFLLVLVLCLFWLASSAWQRRVTIIRDKRPGGPHASWRVSEVSAPLRRFWHVTRDKTGDT
jgi:hypothetical protein